MRDPWFPVTCMLLVVLAAWLGMRGPLPHQIPAFINKWQTLISGLMAVGGAALAYIVARQQLMQGNQLERNRRKRKFDAERTFLPVSLSRIIDYAEASSASLDKILGLIPSERVPRELSEEFQVPPFPKEVMPALREFIEYADDLDVSLLLNLTSWMQIHDARLRGAKRDISIDGVLVSRLNMEGYLCDAVILHAAASAVFRFARREVQTLPVAVSWDQALSSLQLLHLCPDVEQRARERIGRLRELYPTPFDQLREKYV